MTNRLLSLLLCFTLALAAAAPVRADTQDIAAASRSVVRVALVATNGEEAYFVGHGSGVVVAPGRVLTNAHVVELTRDDPNIVIGIIPAEGTRSFGGKVIAYSPGNDLALIAYEDGVLPVATLFAGAAQDGQQVVAIGYPGSVDRAQGMALADIIKPMSPVRTTGTVSGGRSSKQYDTILHTAALASGNSGGPLVDECGRVLGVNSFLSVSEGTDAEYGFAVSNREIANFLRQAGVQWRRVAEPCKSLAELDAADKLAQEKATADARAKAEADKLAAREQALDARDIAQREVIAARENRMALAALLLAMSVLAAGVSFVANTQADGKRRSRWFGIGAGVALLAAVIAFLSRPSFDSVDAADDLPANAASAAIANSMEAQGLLTTGSNLCRIVPDRSRVTVSETSDVPLEWDGQGCINGKTQMAREGRVWTRIFVPSAEPAIAVRTLDPVAGSYRSESYLVDAATADKARAIRKQLSLNGCTADPEQLQALAGVQAQIRSILPERPNERLVYECAAGESVASPKVGNNAAP
jgi:nucleoid-associated protein YgaU